MNKKKGFLKIFPGWWASLGGGVFAIWIGGYAVYGFSALFKPIATELGFSRAATSIVASISRLEGGFEGPVAGMATDRFGPRRVIVLGVFLAGLGMILMHFVDSLWAFYLVWGIILGTGQNLHITTSDTAISNWFVKKRGLALGIKWIQAGLSGAVMLPLIAWLIIQQGWRTTTLIGGVVTWIVCLPIAWFWFKDRRPEYYGLLPDGATVKEETTETGQTIERGVKYATEVEEVEFTLRQAIRTPNYWLLIAAQAGVGIVQPLISIHSVPFLTDIGIEPLKAAGMVAMLMFIGLPFRITGAFLTDHIQKNQFRFLLAGAYSLQAAGFVILLQSQATLNLYLWLIVFGMGQGLAAGLNAPIWARYFGRKAIGSIRGTANMVMTPVGMAAPIYAGWVYDTTGSYLTAFTTATVALSFAIILMALASPPKAPAQISDVRQIF